MRVRVGTTNYSTVLGRIHDGIVIVSPASAMTLLQEFDEAITPHTVGFQKFNDNVSL